MKVPSYDDLTPSIPDVEPADVFGSVDRLLPAPAPVGMGRERPARTALCSGRVELYAALHGGSMDALVAIARNFSPRIERHPSTELRAGPSTELRAGPSTELRAGPSTGLRAGPSTGLRAGPSTELRAGGDVVLDVSGLGRLLGDAGTIAAELARAGASRVAVAPSQIAARLLARGRDGVSVATGDLTPALGGIHLRVLQDLVAEAGDPVLTAHPSPFDIIERWGLKTLGEFATLPAADLSARLGRRGIRLQRLARGIDPRPLVPDPDVARFVQSIELEWPIDALEPLSFVLARLLEPLSAALERADRGAAAIRLDLRLTDRSVHTRVLQLPAPMRDPRVLRTLLLLDLESHAPPAAIDIVTVEADPAPARIVQYSLLERALPSAETVATLTARLDALVGADRCGSAELLDTHRPDAFRMAPFTAATDTALERRATDAQLRVSGGVLRRFRPAAAVRVTLERGRPVRVAIDRQGMPGGNVVQAAGPWRTSGGWWQGTPWDRDEWDLTFRDGVACRISRDRLSGVWFLDGVFD